MAGPSADYWGTAEVHGNNGRKGLLSTANACLLIAALPLPAGRAAAQTLPEAVQSKSVASTQPEAWWTGPIIAASANTLPKGHLLIEPYLFDARTSNADYLGSLTYILYGVTDRLTVGAYPTFGSYRSRGSSRTRRLGVNDLTLNVEYNLRRSRPGSLAPAVAVAIQQIIPTGRYDRLGRDLDRGIGGGSWGTNLCVYTQTSIVLPNGRPLRFRLDATETVSMPTRVRGRSIYGTPEGFRGTANAGDGTFVDFSTEYSVSRRLVIALEVFSRWTRAGLVKGTVDGDGVRDPISAARSYGLAPAVEYSWNSSWGILLGVRRIHGVKSTSSSTTPVLALNVVL